MEPESNHVIPLAYDGTLRERGSKLRVASRREVRATATGNGLLCLGLVSDYSFELYR
ncbi:MAG: hypothetical protein V7K53_32465 [Nostoc sp.]|uniref:hypothetical protein n=1 Tax=Nostoc sp. TaxID=1180 RepID=UPI002FF4C3DA